MLRAMPIWTLILLLLIAGWSLPATAERIDITVSDPGGAAALDIDGDLDLDLVVLQESSGNFSLFLNDGTGNFTPGAELDHSGAPAEALVMDMGEAGGVDDDLVVTYPAADEILFFHNQAGSLVLNQTLTVNSSRSPVSLQVGEDSDDDMDLAVGSLADPAIHLFTNDNGNFSLDQTISLAAAPEAIVVGDLGEDGAGDDDIVVAYSGGFVGLSNDGGSFSELFNVSEVASYRQVALADLDGGGSLDLILCDHLSTRLQVFNNTAGVLSSAPWNISLPANCGALLGQDLLEDQMADTDLVISYPGLDRVDVMLQDGGSFDVLPLDLGDSPETLVLGEFGRGPHLDLAAVNDQGDSVSVFFFETDDLQSTLSRSGPGRSPGLHNFTVGTENLGVSGAAQVERSFTITELMITNETAVFEDDVESGGLALPTSDPSGSAWSMVSNDSASGSNSWHCGNQITGNYDNDLFLTLTTPVIDTSLHDAARLSFNHRYDIEADWDGGVVEVRIDGGNWVVLEADYPGFAIALGIDAFQGISPGWISDFVQVADLGTELEFRFRFESDSFVEETGWWVDDIEVELLETNETILFQDIDTISAIPTGSSDETFYEISLGPGMFIVEVDHDLPDEDPSNDRARIILDLHAFHDWSVSPVAPLPDAMLTAGALDFDVAVMNRGDLTGDAELATRIMELDATQLYANSGVADGQTVGTGGWNSDLVDYYSAPQSWYFGDVSGRTYSSNSDGTVWTPFQNAGGSAVLIEFWQRINSEPVFDGGEVLIDTGSVVTRIGDYPGYVLALGGDGFSGDSGGWEPMAILLESAPPTFRLGFHFASDGSSVDEGWYVDDIRISAVTVTDRLEDSMTTVNRGAGVSATVTASSEVLSPNELYFFEAEIEADGDQVGGNDRFSFTLAPTCSGDTTPPVASTAGDIETLANTPVILDGSSSTDDVGVSAYRWVFDHLGETVELWGVSPSFIFEQDTIVTLWAYDSCGNRDDAMMSVTSPDWDAPVAVASAPASTPEEVPITLDASGSSDDDAIAAYTWSFEDGDPVTYSTTDSTQSHTFAVPGVHDITLEVTDSFGNRDTTMIQIDVLDTTAPLVVFPGPVVVDIGETFQLNASSTTDPDWSGGGPLSFEWTLDMASPVILSGAMPDAGPFSDEGNFSITLTVSDAAGNIGSNTDRLYVTAVGNEVPELEILEPADGTVVSGVVILRGLTSDLDGAVEAVTASVGSITGSANLSQPDEWGVVDWFVELDLGELDPGSHDIMIEVSDDEGATASAMISIEIAEEASARSAAVQYGIFGAVGVILVVLVAFLLYTRSKLSKEIDQIVPDHADDHDFDADYGVSSEQSSSEE